MSVKLTLDAKKTVDISCSQNFVSINTEAVSELFDSVDDFCENFKKSS